MMLKMINQNWPAIAAAAERPWLNCQWFYPGLFKGL